MKSPTTLALTLLTIATTQGGTVAQTLQSRGLFAGAPVMVSLEDSAGVPFDSDQLYLKRPGFHPSSAPQEWKKAGVPAGRPSFDIQAIFQACGARQKLDIDATSMGEDWVIAGMCSGKAVVPINRWAALSFSVTRKTRGRAGSAIRAETNAADGAAADIFSFVLSGSDMPTALVGTTERALDSREIDLGKASATTQRNVNALDQFIPLYTLEPGIADPAPTGMMPQSLTFYFSLTNASAAVAPAAWFGPSGPSGGTILQTSWRPSSRVWSCPVPFMTYRDIGLGAGEDIDALAIDLLNERMLFSTDITIRARNPILHFTWKAGCFVGGIETYVDGKTGNPVSEEIGLIVSDDVDAICATDPSIRSRGGRRNPFYFAVGSPRAPLGLFPPHILNGSSFRDYDGNIMIRTYVSGWPQNTGPAAGLAGLFITPNGAVNPFVHIATYARVPGNSIAGDPRECTLVIPVMFSLLDVPLNFRWFALNAATKQFGEAYPLLVRQ